MSFSNDSITARGSDCTQMGPFSSAAAIGLTPGEWSLSFLEEILGKPLEFAWGT